MTNDDSSNNPVPNFYRASAADFKKIPGSPIAYWVKGSELFKLSLISDHFISGGRNKTHDNEKYLRFFWEINNVTNTWVPYANGGDFRKYYGNDLYVVNWSESARSFYDSNGGLCNPKFWGKEGITWSLITSAISSFRVKRACSQYSSGAPTIFNTKFVCDYKALAFLNSPIARYYLKLNFGNPKNSRSHPITSQIPKYRRLNPTQNRYQPTPRNIPNFAFIPRCRGKVLASHRTAAPRFSRF